MRKSKQKMLILEEIWTFLTSNFPISNRENGSYNFIFINRIIKER